MKNKTIDYFNQLSITNVKIKLTNYIAMPP